MNITHIPFQKTGFFSKTMAAYLEQNKSLQPFYNNFPNLDGFQKQLEDQYLPKYRFEKELRALLNY